MPGRQKAPPIAAKRSHKAGHVALSVQLKCSGWGSDRAKIDASTEVTTEQARALAEALVRLADQADAKEAAKGAAEDRSRQWRDREVSAGRMRIMGVGDFLNGR